MRSASADLCEKRSASTLAVVAAILVSDVKIWEELKPILESLSELKNERG